MNTTQLHIYASVLDYYSVSKSRNILTFKRNEKFIELCLILISIVCKMPKMIAMAREKKEEEKRQKIYKNKFSTSYANASKLDNNHRQVGGSAHNKIPNANDCYHKVAVVTLGGNVL